MSQFGVESDALIVADVAGSVGGGAARLLRELKKYVESTGHEINLIGEGERLTPRWLVKRELIDPRARMHLSLNNAGFVTPFGRNVTMLRNILHFANSTDLEKIGFIPSRELQLQIPLVRFLARQSETLVVPCTRMGEKVADLAPYLADKLTVRFHPVAKPSWAGSSAENARDVLVPIVPQPYKNLDKHLPEFLDASKDLPGQEIRLIVPAEKTSIPELSDHPRVEFIGPQTSEALDSWWRRCGAVFFPVEFESFGYALAEARVYGRNVIAQNTVQNREISGESLCAYERHDKASLGSAILKAVETIPTPDPSPFDPDEYFRWLLTEPRVEQDLPLKNEGLSHE